MIDTDKYEGHTPAPWCYYHSNQFIETEEAIHLFTNCGDIDDPAYDANSELVADAPLLLEEVKRLQIYERIVLCIALHQQLPDGLHVDEELMLRAREHLRKNGEWEGEEE